MMGPMNESVTLLKRGCRWASVALAVSGARKAYSEHIPITYEKYYDVKFLCARTTVSSDLPFYNVLTHLERCDKRKRVAPANRKAVSSSTK